MSEQRFTNVLLSDRGHLAPKDSMQKLIDYAILQDNRSRSRKFHNVKAGWIAAVAVFAFPVCYLIKGSFIGCWNSLHPDHKFSYSFGTIGRSVRLIYRPEIYYRDKQAFFYELEKENIRKEKAGQEPTAHSPLVLWH